MGKLAFFFILGLTALVTIEANNPLKEAIGKSNQLLPRVGFVPATRMLLEDDTYYDTDDMSDEYDNGYVDDKVYGGDGGDGTSDVEDIIDDGDDTSDEYDSGDVRDRGTGGGGGNNGNKKKDPVVGCVTVPNMVSMCY